MDFDVAYTAFANRDEDYMGLFFLGVKTTGVFCRPGCPARLPKRENCEVFKTSQEAVQAGFRACKRCHPLGLPKESGQLIKQLIDLVEANPDRKWSEDDLKCENIDPSTARRQFKSRFGMTFAQYVRQRRLASAQKLLQAGDKVIDAQLSAGFDSPSGFRAAYSKTFGAPPKHVALPPLFVDWIDTELGPMILVTDEDYLYLLEFTVRKNMTQQFKRLSKAYKRPIIPGQTTVSSQAAGQIEAYFAGHLKTFDLPIRMTGTEFQKTVWQALCDIPYGQTRSYEQLAHNIGNEKAVRAVAGSNAKNGLAVIIPCHRVINKSGKLGGYAGGLSKKEWLLNHERAHL